MDKSLSEINLVRSYGCEKDYFKAIKIIKVKLQSKQELNHDLDIHY